MLRPFRIADLPRYYQLMVSEFPKETALLGWRYDAFAKIVRRVDRWDYRLILGFFNAIGRPLFRLWILEADGALAASALQSFGPVSAYVANVFVAPEFRRRGFAKQVLAACHDSARRARKHYVVLDVVDDNPGAAALYDSLGYTPVGHSSNYLRASPTAPPEPAPSPHRREFRKSDGPKLAAIVGSFLPAARTAVQPVRPGEFGLAPSIVRALDSKTASWVLDTGSGAIGWVRATVSPAMEAGHLTAPVVDPSAAPAEVQALVETAVRWAVANGAVRLLSEVADENLHGAAALRSAGFELAYGSRTLARPTGIA
ncbi:MAG: GNAT family N-acetyltransferase [Thermoplasmata archaeon]|nr:GNAT family N-acetyltransferase [Thermoplasmata archaeon]